MWVFKALLDKQREKLKWKCNEVRVKQDCVYTNLGKKKHATLKMNT